MMAKLEINTTKNSMARFLLMADCVAMIFSTRLLTSTPARRREIPTESEPLCSDLFGGFLLLATLQHRSLHRLAGRVPPLVCLSLQLYRHFPQIHMFRTCKSSIHIMAWLLLMAVLILCR